MKHLSKEEFDDLQKFYRINLINSCTGYKSANLLGSISKEGVENVSVFSSITHLGSNPAMLGYILRPTTVPRDTFKNIKETGLFTVNHIVKDLISEAHHTSAKYPEEISEFDKTNNTLLPVFVGLPRSTTLPERLFLFFNLSTS